jgi:hypothetical protein
LGAENAIFGLADAYQGTGGITLLHPIITASE